MTCPMDHTSPNTATSLDVSELSVLIGIACVALMTWAF